MVSVELHWRGAPGRRVEVLGDLPSWKRPRVMIEHAPGEYHLELELPPGVYRYKLRVDGSHWITDPRASSVDPAGGAGNGELVVGGSALPVLFAPDRRHVGRPPGLEIRFEVAGDTPPEGKVALLPSGEPAEVERTLASAGRSFWRARFSGPPPAPGASLELFGGRFELPAHARAPFARPPWLQGAVFYAIFVDRWRRGGGPDPTQATRDRPSTAQTWFGGDLDGITESLDHLAALGATALVLTPIGPARSPHRYDTLDLFRIDPALGGETAFLRLAGEAKARGLKLIVDAPLTHLHAEHPAFLDLLARQEASPYAGWFEVRHFPVTRADPTSYGHYYDRPELPWLDHRSPGARRHAIESVLRLAELGADGARLDAMDEADDGLWSELAAEVAVRHPSFLLLGEVVIDNLAHYAEDRGAHVATDFEHRELLVGFFATGGLDARTFWERSQIAEHRLGALPPEARLLFLDNHDTPRFRSLAITHDRLRLALAYLYFRPEPIWITYGTELGLAGGAAAGARDGVWCERLPMPALPARTETASLLADLARLRADLVAGGAGPISLEHAEGHLLVLSRRRGGAGGKIALALNAGGGRVALPARLRAAASLLEVNGRRSGSGGSGGALHAFSARVLLVSD